MANEKSDRFFFNGDGGGAGGGSGRTPRTPDPERITAHVSDTAAGRDRDEISQRLPFRSVSSHDHFIPPKSNIDSCDQNSYQKERELSCRVLRRPDKGAARRVARGKPVLESNSSCWTRCVIVPQMMHWFDGCANLLSNSRTIRFFKFFEPEHTSPTQVSLDDWVSRLCEAGLVRQKKHHNFFKKFLYHFVNVQNHFSNMNTNDQYETRPQISIIGAKDVQYDRNLCWWATIV